MAKTGQRNQKVLEHDGLLRIRVLPAALELLVARTCKIRMRSPGALLFGVASQGIAEA